MFGGLRSSLFASAALVFGYAATLAQTAVVEALPALATKAQAPPDQAPTAQPPIAQAPLVQTPEVQAAPVQAAPARMPKAGETAALEAHRLALVVGNSAYAAGPLPTATNDAGLLAERLSLHGFDVTAAADADLATLRNVVATFLAKVKAAGPQTIVVVYLTGYGLQLDGENFFVPVDALIPRDVDVAGEAFRLSDLIASLADLPAETRLVVEDLARPTPFAHDGAPLASGLALAEAPNGSLVALDTAPGAVAPTDLATYGIYARVLAELLEGPEPLSAVLFDRLRLRVAQTTDGASVPWDDAKLDSTSAIGGAGLARALEQVTPPERSIAGLSADVAFFLTVSRDRLAGYDDYVAAFANDPLVVRARTMSAVRREARIWSVSFAANAAPAYWTYMRLYPRGPHVYDARRRLAALHAPLDPPPRFDAWIFGDAGRPTADELSILDRQRPPPFDDPAWIPLPQPPDGLLVPPPSDEFDASLPLLPLAGALPLRLPRRLPADAEIGAIDEPFVPGRGDIVSRYRRGTDTLALDTTSNGKLVSRAEFDKGRPVITQRDASGKIISRIVATPDADGMTTVQTGPMGGILAKVVTRTDPNGAHVLTLFDGSNQVVATISRDKNGVVTDMKRIASATTGRFVFEPAATANGLPQAELADRALTAKRPPKTHEQGSAPASPSPITDPPPPPELTVEAAPPPPVPSTPVPPPPSLKPTNVTPLGATLTKPQRSRSKPPLPQARVTPQSAKSAKGKVTKSKRHLVPQRAREHPHTHRK